MAVRPPVLAKNVFKGAFKYFVQLFLVFVATQACFFLFFLLFKVVLFFSVVCKPGFFTRGGSMVFLETVPLNVTKVLKPVAIQWAFEDPDPVSHLKPGSIP